MERHLLRQGFAVHSDLCYLRSMSKKLTIVILSVIALGTGLSGCSPSKASDSRRAELHLQLGTAYLAKGNYPRLCTN